MEGEGAKKKVGERTEEKEGGKEKLISREKASCALAFISLLPDYQCYMTSPFRHLLPHSLSQWTLKF